MPEVELCWYCKEEVDVDKEKFVTISSKSSKPGQRKIAHKKCAQDATPSGGVVKSYL